MTLLAVWVTVTLRTEPLAGWLDWWMVGIVVLAACLWQLVGSMRGMR